MNLEMLAVRNREDWRKKKEEKKKGDKEKPQIKPVNVNRRENLGNILKLDIVILEGLPRWHNGKRSQLPMQEM